MKRLNCFLEIENLPGPECYVQKTEPGHRAAKIAVGNRLHCPRPVKPVDRKYEKVVFVPGWMPGEVYEQHSHFEANDYEEEYGQLC